VGSRAGRRPGGRGPDAHGRIASMQCVELTWANKRR
jgi:hypothetical protein